MFFLAFLLKIGIVPFNGWFIYSVKNFPNGLLAIACTLHKIPLLLLLVQFPQYLDPLLLWFILRVNVILRGVMMFYTIDLRLFIVHSSVANNSWLLLSACSGVIYLIGFIIVYFFLLLTFLTSLSSNLSV
jgi:hypothetical protein